MINKFFKYLNFNLILSFSTISKSISTPTLTFSTINKFPKSKGKMFECYNFSRISLPFSSCHTPSVCLEKDKGQNFPLFRLFFSLAHEKKNIYNILQHTIIF